MQLIPAIDIRNGRCVRLFQGDFEQETRYEFDPVELARRYGGLGAAWLHIVDLDGAAAGHPVNLGLIRRMAASAGVSVQLGGGIRDRKALEAALEVADRVVLGSLAITAENRVTEWFAEFGAERFTLGLDVRIGEDALARITTHGWTEVSDRTLDDTLEAYSAHGLKHVLCTDVERDGAMTGPNVELYRQCCERWPRIGFQASGGVRSAEDLQALSGTGVAGAISGKALLEGRISAEEILRFLPGE